MSVLVSMRFRVRSFHGMEEAIAKYGESIKRSGCNWYRVYRRDLDPQEVLWLMEFESHEAFERSSSGFGADFVDLISPLGEWDDAVWEIAIQS